jgi:hypothetical protein
VHVVQELGASQIPESAPRIDDSTQVSVRVDGDGSVGGGGNGGNGGHIHTGGGGGHIKTGGGLHGFHFGGGGGGKGAAIVLLVVAATALFVVAAVEADRFDGYADFHPMHPVHLVGPGGSYLGYMPMAWIDPQTAAQVDHAVVRPHEGPLRLRERARLQRYGWTYGMYGGTSSIASADGTTAFGTTFAIQLGYFPDNRIGILGNAQFGWRDNTYSGTVLDTRYTLEVHALPVAVGPLHLGLYGGAGAAYRYEDGPLNGNASGTALVGGATLQLELATRVALTARAGIARVHGDDATDVLVGLSVY